MPLQAAEQVGPSGVPGVVARQLQPVDERQRDLGPVQLGDRDCAVQRDHRLTVNREQLVVELDDLRQSVIEASSASVCTALIAAWSW